jgi:biotin carboxylase
VTGQPALLVIGGGGAGSHVADWSLRIRAAAVRHGVRLEIGDRPSELLDSAPSSAVAATWEVDYEDVGACVALARERASALDGALVGVAAFREMAVESAAAAAAAVGVEWNRPDAVRTVRRKQLCRAHLRDAGFTQPECRAFELPAEATAFLRGAGADGSWIVKPSSAFGSQGVSLVTSPRDVDDAVAGAAAYGLPVLVETFVSGVEFSVEGVFVRREPQVVAVTRKVVTAPPRFVELGHVVPAGLEPETVGRVVDEARRALGSVGLSHSAFHVELWLTPAGEIVLGELHARPGGDWIHALVDACYGVDLLDVAIADLLGRAGPISLTAPTCAAAVVAAEQHVSGVLERVDGVGQARADPRCLAVDVLARPGVQLAALSSSFDRVAMVAARGGDAGTALAAAHELAAGLDFALVS